MDKAELAEIRARLRASAEPETRKPRKRFFSGVRALLAPAPVRGAPATPAYPPPRRAGVRPQPEAVEDFAELTLDEPLAPEAPARRPAFGHRRPAAPEPVAPRLLAAPAEPPAPALDEADVGEALRRLGSRLARSGQPAAETPYLPEDLSDADALAAERLFAQAGVAAGTRDEIAEEVLELARELQIDIAPAPEPAPAPLPDLEPEPEPESALEPSAVAEVEPEPAPAAPTRPRKPRSAKRAAALLRRLERTMLAEQAALDARRDAA